MSKAYNTPISTDDLKNQQKNYSLETQMQAASDPAVVSCARKIFYSSVALSSVAGLGYYFMRRGTRGWNRNLKIGSITLITFAISSFASKFFVCSEPELRALNFAATYIAKKED